MYMYLLNPKNGQLVNAKTGEDVEYISWPDVIKDVKRLVIGINGNVIAADYAEEAITPFQEWLAKEHPEVDLSLHSGEIVFGYHDDADLVLEVCHYGMFVAMTTAGDGKSAKLVHFTRIGQEETEQVFHVKKDRQGGIESMTKVIDIPPQPPVETEINLEEVLANTSPEDAANVAEVITDTIAKTINKDREHNTDPRRSWPSDIPVGQEVQMSDEDKEKIVQGIRDTNELLKSGHPLINSHFQAGISPGRLYMMGSHTDAAKSKLVTPNYVNLELNKAIAFAGRAMRVCTAFENTLPPVDNQNALDELNKHMGELAGSHWARVEKDMDADLVLVFDGTWWVIAKARGCIELVGQCVVFKEAMMEAARNVNVEDAYPKGPDAPEQGSLNAYRVNWEDALQGILIIVDVQEHMTEADTQLNREMLGRVTDAILSKSLEANITVRGDTKNDAETRLAQEITNAHCVIEICGGTAYICKFRMYPELKDREIF